MGKILHLPEPVIRKIAAGEVIERPAFALKELIENSIDAGADYIRIDIEESGLKKLSVTDNGVGMDEEDTKICFQRYTTSKIFSEEQLNAVRSFGFRGEALASIAAVSRIHIKSKLKGQNEGTEVIIHDGEIEDISPIGMPHGTVVTIENLFHSLPVRQKFLEHSVQESRQIMQVLIQAGIANSHIKFFVTHNKKTILDLPKETGIDRLKSLFGNPIVDNLLLVSKQINHLHIEGYIAKPQIVGRAIPKQYLFVNGRGVKHKQVANVIKKAYGTLLPPEATPMFILFLSIPFELVDVNVHPRKEEVHLLQEKVILNYIGETIKEVLFGAHITYHDTRWQRSQKDIYTNPLQEQSYVRDGGTDSYMANVLKNQVLDRKTVIISSSEITQVHNLYLLLPTHKGLLVIDQHAAHERILYERFLHAFKGLKNQGDQYILPKTIVMELSVYDRQVLQEHIELFTTLGFDIQAFGENTFTIRAVPRIFKDRNVRELVVEYIEDIVQSGIPKELDVRTHRMLAYLSCRSAIKSGEKLTKKEAKKLFVEFWNTPNKETCPHGRPAYHEIPLQDINHFFRRISKTKNS